MAEVVELLSGAGVVVDATVGAGGHAEALLDAGVARVVGVDRDAAAIGEASRRLERFGPRFTAARGRFSALGNAARDAGVEPEGAGGVLFDLGVSSMHLDQPERGFSYRMRGPLDMRMSGDDGGMSAADIVNTYPEEELAHVIFVYGEERFSRRIAGAIVRARARSPIATTDELAAIVAGAVPKRKGGGHPARRTFQALRIEVNHELEEVTASLPQATDLLEPGGTLIVISYHSLEDRIVKRFVLGEDRLQALTKRPVVPSATEAASNPRARSAKLRAARRIGDVEVAA
jgi:16S rRNA (cytosine1402-N4)-methyltransferase